MVTIYVRPQRFSKILLDQEEYFTLCFFDNKKKELAYLGSHSGRNEDKIAKIGFHNVILKDYSYIEEASLVLVCKKIYRQTLKEECFIDKNIIEDCYANKDFHDMYIPKIEKVLIK